MKKLFIIALALLSTTTAFADHCSMESKIIYDENGMATFHSSSAWAMGTRSMDYFNNPEDCFAEGLKWVGFIKADPSAASLIFSVMVSYGEEKNQISKVFELHSN